MAIDSRALGGAIVRKSIVINSSQNWTAPANLAGNTVWITASGGGGGGANNSPASSNNIHIGAYGGEYCVCAPVIVTASTSYVVTIGAGGAGGAPGGAGGSTSFASLITLRGGSPASSDLGTPVSASVFYNAIPKIGIRSGYAAIVTSGSSESFVTQEPERAGRFTGEGRWSYDFTSAAACGYFGVSAAGSNAPANTGAGGYSGGLSGTGMAGGSGKMIIEWEEFL